MFKAVKSLKSVKQIPPLTVHTPDGKCIGSDQGKVEANRCWFQQLFSDPNHEHLEPYTGDPRPLNTPITPQKPRKHCKPSKQAVRLALTTLIMNY